MKKILPMAEPMIKGYPWVAHIFAVSQAQSDFIFPWAYNYFVQLHTRKNFVKEQCIDYTIPHPYIFTPGMYKYHFPRNVALESWDGILGFIRTCINQGYYIYGLFDVSKISAYNCNHFWAHDPLLYGYDDEKKEIYFADNYKFGKYSLGVASYEEILMATNELSSREDVKELDWMQGFRCIQYSDAYKPYLFDKDTYVDLLNDYLYQRISTYRWVPPWGKRNKHEGVNWGIGVYAVMREYMQYAKEHKNPLDKRSFYVLKEHKQIMVGAINYLFGEGWQKMFPAEHGMLMFNVDTTTIMLNLCLKYNLTFDVRILDKLEAYLLQVEESEREFIPLLIKMVEDSE